MSSENRNSVWSQLKAADIVTGEPPSAGHASSPWFVNALTGFCGWLAAVFMLALLLAVFQGLFRQPLALIPLGSITIFLAFFLLLNQNNMFTQNLGLAFSMAGQVHLIFGLTQILPEQEFIIGITIFAIQLLLCLVMPSYIHRVISMFIACLALYFSIRQWPVVLVYFGLLLFLSALVWLNEFKLSKQHHRIQPIGYGLVLAVIILTATRIFDNNTLTLASTTSLNLPPLLARIITQLAIAAAALYVAYKILPRCEHRLSGRAGVLSFTGIVLLCALATFAPGVAIGATILFIGYANSNRILMTLGILSLIFYVSHYYYQLDTTLLVKAMTMLVIGLALLGGRYVISVVLPQDKRHA